MPWPAIPILIYTDAVKVRSVTWTTKDAAGGRVPTYGAWSGSEYACSVSAVSANEQAVHSRENMVVSHVVTSNTRLGYLRDQLQWQETGAVLTITSVEPAGDGTGRIWNHYATELPLR
jgi:hypothetical protein